MSKNEPDANSAASPTEAESTGLLGTTRRKFVASGTATWASVSLAGCLGDDGEGDDGEDETPHYVVTDEVVAGSEGIPEGAGGLITSGRTQRAFVPGMEAVFKIGVWDPETGDIVSDDTIDEATISLDTGDDVELEFSSTDREWTGSWMIPEDAEAGAVGYDVEVTNGAEFTEVGIASNELEIIDFAPQASNYVVTVDTIAIDDRAPESGGGYVQSCMPNHNFTNDMAVGFHIGIYDGGNGEMVGPDVVDEATLEFSDGDPDSVELEWDSDAEEWGYTWRGIPEGFTGEITYEVQVTSEAGDFYNVGIESGSINVIEQPDLGGDPAENFVVTDELYSTDDKAPESGGGFVQSCMPNHHFTPDMAVGIETGIWDANTGEMVGPDRVDEVILTFSDGDPAEVEAEWGPGFDDNDEPNEWTPDDHAWDVTWYGIPEGFSGTIEYEIAITSEADNIYRVGVYQGSFEVIEDPGL